jgi:leucyl-tRNA synthetase
VIESFKFNVAVARIMELVKATRKAIDGEVGAADPAVREAAEAVAIALSLFAPYTAEDMWEKLGHEATVALAGLPDADPSLLVEDSVTAVVQVDGKVRDRLEVAPGIDPGELESLARGLASVQRTVGDRQIVKVIVRAPRLVNLVTR